jgi:predicted GIY-YIG superfamily endonuclease
MLYKICSKAKDIFINPISEREEIKQATKGRGGIYCWYCRVTGKFYIGSAKDLYKRLSRYYQVGYRNYHAQAGIPILRAINKYGLDNFYLMILDYTTFVNLYLAEQFFMDVFLPTYNLLLTAGSKPESIIRPPMSEGQKALLASKRGSAHHSHGTKRTPNELALMRDNHPKTKVVYQYLSDRVTLVAQFPSLRVAQHKTGITRNYIVRCIRNGELAHNTWWFSFSPTK